MKSPHVILVGIGSPHGDDRTGYEIVAGFEPPLGVRCEKHCLTSPVDLVEVVGGADLLLIVDACRSGTPPGTVQRWEWPDERLGGFGGCSTHGFSVVAALQLGQALERLPRRVVVIGVEGESASAGTGLSPPVREAIPAVQAQLRVEIESHRKQAGK